MILALRILERLVEELRRAIYDKRSEKRPLDDRQLAFEDLEGAVAEVEEAVAASGAAPASPGRRRRAPRRNLGHLPKDLERIERVIEPESADRPCGRGEMIRIGEDRAERQARTAPPVEDFGMWLRKRRARISPKSRLGEKLAYIGNHWDGLRAFLADGRVEMDNNIVENTIRPLALNRKNALFAGHVEGAAAWARVAERYPLVAFAINICAANHFDLHAAGPIRRVALEAKCLAVRRPADPANNGLPGTGWRLCDGCHIQSAIKKCTELYFFLE